MANPCILLYGECPHDRYPHAGYGGTFIHWLAASDPQPYGSWGNGSAMRVSPVGWAFATVDAVLQPAARSAEISHNHPEGVNYQSPDPAERSTQRT